MLVINGAFILALNRPSVSLQSAVHGVQGASKSQRKETQNLSSSSYLHDLSHAHGHGHDFLVML